MNELVLLTSNKERNSGGGGICAVDISTGEIHKQFSFKHNCIADSGCITSGT